MNNLPDEKQHELARRTLTDYLLYFPAVIISGFMGLITVTVLSKFFSPDDYGHYALAMTTMLLLSMVTGLWLHSSVVRLLPQYNASHQMHEFVGTLLGAGSMVTLVVVSLYALGLIWLKPTLNSQLYQLLWLIVPGSIILTTFAGLLEAHRIRGYAALYSGLRLLQVVGGFLAGLALVVIFDWGPAGMLLGMIFVLASAVAGHLVVASRRLTIQARLWCWSGSVLKEMSAYALPIVGVNIASTILAISDRYLIEAYLNSYDLGIYTVNYSLAEGGMRLIVATLLIAVEPTIFNSWVTHGPQVAFRFVERLFRYYWLLALPALVGLSLLRHDIVALFATPEYASGSVVMIFVSLALFLHGNTLIVGTIFDAAKRTMIPFVVFLIAASFNVGLNLLLLPRFGYVAAAWSTCAGYGLLLMLSVIASRRIVHLRLVGGYLWQIGLASAGMGLFIVAAQHWLPSSILSLTVITLLAGIIYFVLLLALGGILPEEKQELKTRLRKFLIRWRRPVFVRNGPA